MGCFVSSAGSLVVSGYCRMHKQVTAVFHIFLGYYCSRLVCFLDLFNNEVVEWQLSESFDNTFVLQAVRRLLEKAKRNTYPILLHSDQGNRYSSSAYQFVLKEYQAIQSMSRAGNPRDNAVIESFFGRFKDILRFQFRYWEADDLSAVITDAIHYFNAVRPVRKLNGKPPAQFRLEQVA